MPRCILSCALIALAVLSPSAGRLAAQTLRTERPAPVRITLSLEDGRSYTLPTEQVQEPRGGALFWGDWAVVNLLLPQYRARPARLLDAAKVLRLWFTPGASGQLPAFLVNTPEGPVYPLDQPSEGGWHFTPSPRPRVAAVEVEYGDGRVLHLSEYVLRDPKSGVMVWTDFAVANFFIPFYRNAQGLPTRPEDVMRLWHQRVPALGFRARPDLEELPGFLVKPECIPSYQGE